MRSRLARWTAVGPLPVAITLALAQPAAGQVVDSIRPIEEELARFRATVPEAVSRLAGGASSRSELVRRFVRAVESRDTTALREMIISRAEFAYLYYPSTIYTRPPYRQAPGLVWFRITSQSQRGIGRVLERDGGRPLGYVGYRCDPRPTVQDANRIWTGCFLRVKQGDETVSRRLFGSILERDGRFKFLGYQSEY